MAPEKYELNLPEKGNIEKITHFLKCTEQAELRAQEQWLKQACEYRRRMLIRQLASMKEKSVV